MFSTWKFLWSVQLIYTFYFKEWSVAAFLFPVLMEIEARIHTKNLRFCENVQWGLIRSRLFSLCHSPFNSKPRRQTHFLDNINYSNGGSSSFSETKFKKYLEGTQNRKRTEKIFSLLFGSQVVSMQPEKIHVINSIILMGIQRSNATLSGHVWRAM